jgi:hypothetical protein
VRNINKNVNDFLATTTTKHGLGCGSLAPISTTKHPRGRLLWVCLLLTLELERPHFLIFCEDIILDVASLFCARQAIICNTGAEIGATNSVFPLQHGRLPEGRRLSAAMLPPTLKPDKHGPILASSIAHQLVVQEQHLHCQASPRQYCS